MVDISSENTVTNIKTIKTVLHYFLDLCIPQYLGTEKFSLQTFHYTEEIITIQKN